MSEQPSTPKDYFINPVTGVPISIGRNKPSDDFNKYIQEMEELIQKVDYALQSGYAGVDREGNPILVKIPGATPMINDAGRLSVISKLRSVLNPNTYMALFTEKDTQNNFLLEARSFSSDLVKNHKKYALSLENYHQIMNMVTFVLFSAMRKAETDKSKIYDPGSPIKGITDQPQHQGFSGLFKW